MAASRATGGDQPRRPGAATWAGRAVLVLGVVGAGLWTATHRIAGVGWADVSHVLTGVGAAHLVVLAAVWLGGLGVYSLVLSAALPGLGVRRSLLLNLSGSAVANLLPLGGAVATALNWRMVRSWGHSDLAFVAYCVLTNALDVAGKLALPLVAVGAMVVVSTHVPGVLWGLAGACAVLLLLGGAALLLQGVLARSGRAWSPRVTVHLDRVRASGDRVRGLFRAGWLRLLPATAAYLAAQVALLALSLQAVGLHTSLVVVLAAAAIERIGTIVAITPGGAGVAEIGTIAWLVASGLDPVEVVAGVLLYRVFLVVMEIPVGGALLVAWAFARRLRPPALPGVAVPGVLGRGSCT